MEMMWYLVREGVPFIKERKDGLAVNSTHPLGLIRTNLSWKNIEGNLQGAIKEVIRGTFSETYRVGESVYMGHNTSNNEVS